MANCVIHLVHDGVTTCIPETWYHDINKDKQGFYPWRPHSEVTPLNCGSNTLPSVQTALEQAKKNIEITLWCFDPAARLNGYPDDLYWDGSLMASLKTTSPRVGDVLLAAVQRKVEVRLLIWVFGDLMFNLPKVLKLLRLSTSEKNWFDTLRNLISPIENFKKSLRTIPELSTKWRYRKRWYEEIEKYNNVKLLTAGPGITDIVSSIGKEALDALIKKIINSNDEDFEQEMDDDSNTDPYARFMQRHGPSHHQKTIMVDYEDPPNAVGFVMGNNIRTVDYDTPKHYANYKVALRHKGCAPRQDVSSHVLGQALYDVNDNFCDAWTKAGGDDLRGPRAHLKPDNFSSHNGKLIVGTAQVSRTIMRASDEGFIADSYSRAIDSCTQFIYMENQYFRYKKLATYLQNHANKRKGGAHYEIGDPIYWFAVINCPGIGEVGNTYDMIEELGHEQQMPAVLYKQWSDLVSKRNSLLAQNKELEQHKSSHNIHSYLESEADKQKHDESIDKIIEANNTKIEDELNPKINELEGRYPNIGKGRQKIQDAEKASDAFTLHDSESLKGHLATLMVSEPKTFSWKGAHKYTPVNIHSKVTIVDDIFVTIGSANINRRGMVSDGEINIATTKPVVAKGIRENLFFYHLGKPIAHLKKAKRMYNEWKTVMDNNWEAMHKGHALDAPLVYFYDPSSTVNWAPRLD